MEKQEQVRLIYHELQGYLSKAPSSEGNPVLSDRNL
jgi:hypothetical protein